MTPEKLFATRSNLPFLNYQFNAGGALSLHADVFPIGDIGLPFTDWFEAFDLSFTAGWDTNPNYLALIVNSMRNEIARATRRAAGNIAFVPSLKRMLELETHKGILYDLKIIVDEQLEENEIRVMYWKNYDGQAVDGGFQFSPEGWAFMPDYRKYSLKAFL